MATAKKMTIPTTPEIRSEAVQALIEGLGITKAAFFLRDSMSQKTDYVKIKEKLFGKASADEIYAEMKKK